MKRIAYTEVSGPEAHGEAMINQLQDGRYELVLSGFWVAPGAPDVWVAISPETYGLPKASTIDLASYDYSQKQHQLSISENIDLQEIKTVIIYCKKFNVHFGYGVLQYEPKY